MSEELLQKIKSLRTFLAIKIILISGVTSYLLQYFLSLMTSISTNDLFYHRHWTLECWIAYTLGHYQWSKLRTGFHQSFPFFFEINNVLCTVSWKLNHAILRSRVSFWDRGWRVLRLEKTFWVFVLSCEKWECKKIGSSVSEHIFKRNSFSEQFCNGEKLLSGFLWITSFEIEREN